MNSTMKRIFTSESVTEGHPIDIGCVTYWRNGIAHHRYFINSVGFGVDPLCCKIAETLKYYLGSHHVNYLFGLIAAIIRHKAQHMVLTVDGQQAVDDLLFTMNVGNGPFSGGGIKQNPEADPTDGVFHTMFVKTPTFRQVLEAIPKLYNGRLTELPFVYPICGKHHCKQRFDGRYRCDRCKHNFSVISGTIFENTKVSLRKWFIAMYLLDGILQFRFIKSYCIFLSHIQFEISLLINIM